MRSRLAKAEGMLATGWAVDELIQVTSGLPHGALLYLSHVKRLEGHLTGICKNDPQDRVMQLPPLWPPSPVTWTRDFLRMDLDIFVLLLFFSCLLCVCVHGCVSPCGGQRTIFESDPLLPPCEFHGTNLGHRSGWQVSHLAGLLIHTPSLKADLCSVQSVRGTELWFYCTVGGL